MPRATRTQKATDKPDQPAEAPPAKRTRRSRMQDDALEDADQLDKQLAAVRNKCRKLAVDFDWDAIDDMVLSTEFVELGKKADALTDAKIAKMSEEEKDEMLKELRADIRQAAIAESARNDSMPRNEGEEDAVGDAAAAEKQANIVANRADVAGRQADAAGLSIAAREKAVADAVAKAEAAAAEKARKQMEAVQAKQAEAEAKAKAAQKKVEEAEKALDVERKAKEAAEKAQAAEEKKTRAASKQAADANKAKAKAEAEMVASVAASAYKAKGAKKSMPVNEGMNKRKKSNPPSPAQSEDAEGAEGAEEPEPVEVGEDGGEDGGEESESESEAPSPPKKKKRMTAAEKKEAFIEEKGQEAWDELEQKKQEKKDEADEKKRKIDNFDKVEKKAKAARETLTNANKQINELEGDNTHLEETVAAQDKKLERAKVLVKKLKKKRANLGAAVEALMALAEAKGASAEEVEEAKNTVTEGCEGDDDDAA